MPQKMRTWLPLWFGFRLRVDRKAYVASGIALMCLKYAIEVALVFGLAGRLWSPLEFVNPLFARFNGLGLLLQAALIAISLPFAWIGASMTARRALDAAISPLVALMFFVPVVNLLTIALLATLPSQPPSPELINRPVQIPASGVRSALIAAAVSLVLVAIATVGLKSYGEGLFLGTPFVTGAVSGWLFNRGTPRTVGSTLGVATVALLFTGGALLLTALEGGVCLAMAFPLAWFPAVIGALISRQVALRGHDLQGPLGLWFVVLISLAGASGFGKTPAITDNVTSSIVVDTSIEEAWKHVVQFAEIKEPPRGILRTGIAYPIRARIEGDGRGAVRYCEFSTGPFVEPITQWQEPTLLAFDVSAQPATMTELSFYNHVFAPHLTRSFKSQRGQFRLTALKPTKTLIEGTTWYTLDLKPAIYWNAWAAKLVHDIHLRVLRHIKAEAEGAPALTNDPAK